MAMSKCKECGNEISSKAKSCPQCGSPAKKSHKLLIILIIVLGLPFSCCFWSSIFMDSDVPSSGTNSSSNNSTPVKNPNDYIEIRRCNPDFLEDIKVYSDDGKYISTDRGIPAKYLHKGPGTNYPVDGSGHIIENEKLFVLGEQNGWIEFRVTHDDVGWSGWLPKKLTISEKEIRAKREAKFGKCPEVNSNGSVDIVRLYILMLAKDPDSIKFEQWYSGYNENDGWLTFCVYRGKNSFGVYDKAANWFVIRWGDVVDVKEADAYSF